MPPFSSTSVQATSIEAILEKLRLAHKMWEEENKEKSVVEIIGDITWIVNFWIGNASIILHVVVMLFFVVHFVKRDSTILTPYFIMLFCCSFFELIRLLSWSAMIIHGWWDWGDFHEVAARTEWYSVLYTGCWNTVLALNRFTAIMFPMKYDKIWTGKLFYLILVALILYPFAIDFPTISQFTLCWYAFAAEDCLDFGLRYQQVQAYSNAIHVLLSLGISAATLLGNRKFQVVQSNNVERRLFYQSLYSSILWTCQTLIFTLAVVNFFKTEHGNPVIDILLQFGFIVLGFYHYSTLIILFVLSVSFRQKILRFYFPCWNQPKVFVIQSTSSLRSQKNNNTWRN